MSLHVLEWSRKQQGFHIQPLSDAIAGNRTAFAENRSSDYVVLHVGSRDECSAAADQLRPIVRKRAKETV